MRSDVGPERAEQLPHAQLWWLTAVVMELVAAHCL